MQNTSYQETLAALREAQREEKELNLRLKIVKDKIYRLNTLTQQRKPKKS